MEVEKKKFVDKELEGFEKVDDIAPNKSIRQEFKSDNYELFFFQFPKSVIANYQNEFFISYT